MEILPAKPEDAPEISVLLARLSAPFFVSPDRRGADGFVASIAPAAIARNIAADNFRYHVARHDGQLAGMGAMRDAAHLFQLFVDESFQGHGLARAMWTRLRQEAEKMASPTRFTVNASLTAVVVYVRFGFVCEGPPRELNGVTFQPMQLLRTVA